MQTKIKSGKHLWLLILVLINSCTHDKQPIVTSTMDGNYHVKIWQFKDKIGYKYYEYYDSLGNCSRKFETINDTLEGRYYSYDLKGNTIKETHYEKGLKHGVERKKILNKNESFEYLYLKDTVQLVKQVSKDQDLCYRIYNIKNGNEIGDMWCNYVLKDDVYVNIFDLTNESIDWSKSSGYYDNLPDTLILNKEYSFELNIVFNSKDVNGEKCLGSEFILFDSSLYFSKEDKVLCDKKTDSNSNIIHDKIKIRNSKTRLLMGLISSAFYDSELKDTLYTHNTFYKQIYVK